MADQDQNATPAADSSAPSTAPQTPLPPLIAVGAPPNDLILTQLTAAVSFVVDLSNNLDSPKDYVNDVDYLVSVGMPPPSENPRPVPERDKCTPDNTDPVAQPLCAALALADAQAQFTYKQAANTAIHTLQGLAGQWQLAVISYKSALNTALAAKSAAILAAKTAYTTSRQVSPDAVSRWMALWYTMLNAVISAVQAYESSAAAAEGALATAAGNLLAGYAAYAGQIKVAEEARLAAVSAAELTFWQQIESGRDG